MDISKNSNGLSRSFSAVRLIILAAVLLFHAGLVFRFRIVQLFPAEWTGYAFIGTIFFLIAAGLLWVPQLSAENAVLPLPGFISSAYSRYSMIALLCGTIAAGLFWRYHVYAGTVIRVQNGDMLPLIKMACNVFLSGEFPYRTYELPWKLPLTYLPGIWMPYLPSQMFSFDPRHIGLFFSALVMVVLFVSACRRPADRTGADTAPGSSAELLLAGLIGTAAFCLSPAIARFSINGHTYPLWFYISLFAYCILQGHYRTAAVCFGLVLATRQTSAVYLPFFLLFYWRLHDRNLFISMLVLTGLTCGILWLPFALVDFRAFLLDPMDAYAKMAAWDFSLGEKSYASRTIGFAFALKKLGWMTDLNWLRYLLLAAAPLIAWQTVRDTCSLLVSMGAMGIILALITPVPWYYIFVPPVLLLSFAALSGSSASAPPLHKAGQV